MRLKDKVAVITGAGQGIGKATALEFAKEGAKVAVNDIFRETIDGVVAEVNELGQEAIKSSRITLRACLTFSELVIITCPLAAGRVHEASSDDLLPLTTSTMQMRQVP